MEALSEANGVFRRLSSTHFCVEATPLDFSRRRASAFPTYNTQQQMHLKVREWKVYLDRSCLGIGCHTFSMALCSLAIHTGLRATGSSARHGHACHLRGLELAADRGELPLQSVHLQVPRSVFSPMSASRGCHSPAGSWWRTACSLEARMSCRAPSITASALG